MSVKAITRRTVQISEGFSCRNSSSCSDAQPTGDRTETTDKLHKIESMVYIRFTPEVFPACRLSGWSLTNAEQINTHASVSWLAPFRILKSDWPRVWACGQDLLDKAPGWGALATWTVAGRQRPCTQRSPGGGINRGSGK